MVTNDFSRSSFLSEQYQREMELIAVALQEESQEEQDERLNLVAQAWPHTVACFQEQLPNADPVLHPVVLAH